jgi:hypothetical protein
VPCFLHASATTPDPHRLPLRFLLLPPLFKKGTPPPLAEILPPPHAVIFPLRSDAAPQPPPSPPPRATGQPRRLPEPSRPCRRLPHQHRHRHSDPSHRVIARVSPASTPPARRHSGTPPVLTGSTLPPASPHRTASMHGTRPVSTRCGPPLRLGWAARPWPSRPSGRPCVASRRAERRKPWVGLRHVTVQRFLSFFQLF